MRLGDSDSGQGTPGRVQRFMDGTSHTIIWLYARRPVLMYEVLAIGLCKCYPIFSTSIQGVLRKGQCYTEVMSDTKQADSGITRSSTQADLAYGVQPMQD